ncbi:EF-hand [Parathielavia hyrcaniae]|uniref:EF-hand n=1 Tax=Parathielavia hyrcaniae TaxID=113614 RepID=A0AAN6QAM9_9PEZI|nr:EF-hand [Parathielavia hyrcaniae]
MSIPSAYKPSPLGYGSPRSSPFRRPQSPVSPSALRQTTPSTSPTKQGVADIAAKFMSSPATSPAPEPRTIRRHDAGEDALEQQLPQQRTASRPPIASTAGLGNALSQLQPSQVRTMREGFQILDRDSDSLVNREDVMDMLNQLGLPSNASDVAHFFPPSGPQTITMALFLNSIAAPLAALSPSSELLSAFSAFDDDDSGQIDVEELRDALLHTAPEPGQEPLTALDVEKVIAGFTGRRAFSKVTATGLGKRGEVFRYQEFVTTIAGGNGGPAQAAPEAEDD